MIDISEEVKKVEDSFEINECGESIRTSNEETFDQSTLESSLSTFVFESRTSEFEQASQTLKKLPRYAIQQNKQNDVVLPNRQEEEK